MGQIDSISKSRVQENFFLTFWILVGAVALTLFLKTDYRLSFSGEQKKIGEIQFLAESAKVKGTQALSWFKALEGQSLHHFDQIYTHQGAKLEIDLFESGRLVVHENTLLRLVDSQNGTSVDLGQGLISATLSDSSAGNKELVFSMNGKIYQLTSSDAQVQIINNKKTAQVQLISGSLSLTSDEEVVTFNQDQQLTIGEDGISESKVFQAELLAPKHHEVFYTASQKQISFAWSSSDDVKLRVARDPHFKTLVHLGLNQLQKQTLALAPGVYYWRLEAALGDDLGVVQKFEIIQEEAPVWIGPSGLNSQVRLERESDQVKTISLSWKSSGQEHLLQIGRRQEDQEIDWVMNEKVSGYQYDLQLDQTGEYIARVKIIDSLREEAIWSHDIFFRVWSHELKTPRYLLPKDRSTFIVFEESSSQKVSWRALSGVTSYEVSWKNPQGVEGRKKLRDTQFDIPLQGGGQYQWQVRSLDGDESSPFSEWMSFEIQKENFNPSVPENGVLIELDRPDQMVRFEWARAQNVKSYIFQMSEQQDFSSLSLEESGKLPRTEVKVANIGVFYWRTKVITNDGKEYYSNPFRVIIEPSAPPKQPKIKGLLKIEYLKSSMPDLKKSFLQSLLNLLLSNAHAQDELLDQNPEESFSVKISWPMGPENIKAYKIRIYQKGQPALLELVTEESEFIWDQAFEGEFLWEVAYLDYWDRLGPFSEPEIFAVTDQDKVNVVKFSDIKEIRLIRPRHALKIDQQSELLFSWDVSPGDVVVDSFRLEIATDLAMNDLVFSHDLPKDTKQFVWQKASQIPLPLFWRVTAVQGEIKTLSLRRRLDLKEVVSKNTITKEKDKSSANTEDKTTKKLSHSFDIYYQIGQYNFEQVLPQAATNLEIDGQSIMGLRIDWNFSKGNLSLQNSGGKVFEDQKFRRTTVNTSYHMKHFSDAFTLSAVASVLRASVYEQRDERILESSRIDAAAGLSLCFQKEKVEARASFVFGSYFSPSVEAFWHADWLSVGAGYEMMTLSNERSVSGVKLFLGKRLSY